MLEEPVVALDKNEESVASDAQLVALSLRDGGTEAFSELVRRYTGMVIGTAIAILGDRHEAEDAAQEAFARAYRSLGQLKEHNRFSAWLTTITSNTARRRGTKKRPLPLRESGPGPAGTEIPDETQVAPDEQMARSETHAQILAAMEELPEAYRGTVFLRCLRGHTCREIAEIEGVSVGVVTSRLSRAYEMLRTRLRPILMKGGDVS